MTEINNNDNIECCICYEQIGEKNKCTTPCGHKFCFNCMMKSLNVNNTCPCCRAVLQEKIEEAECNYEDDESEYESEPDEDLDYTERCCLSNSKTITSQLELKGYSMSDMVTLYLGRLYKYNERSSNDFIRILEDDILDITEIEDELKKQEHHETCDMMNEDTHRHNGKQTNSSFIDTVSEYNIINLFA